MKVLNQLENSIDFKNIFEKVPWAQFLLRFDNEQCLVNAISDKALGLLNCSRENIIGNDFSVLVSSFKTLNVEYSPMELQEKLKQFLKDKENAPRLLLKTNGWDLTATPVLENQDQCFSLICHFTESKAHSESLDETTQTEKNLNLLNTELERKVQERTAELEKARYIADNANRIKSVFLANMSHEIRTPLGAVLGYAELLANKGIQGIEREKFISAIKRNGELLSNIINDILDLSKVEVELREVLLSDVLTDMASLLSLRALNKGIRLQVNYHGDIPKIIRTDVLRLRQILINIIGNAIKFTDQGSVEVTIKCTKESAGQNKLTFDVKDTGPGISEENIKNLFQPFFQVDPSARREFGGTGLGLVLSRNLAKLLGGDVALVESSLRQGSLFSVSVNPGPVEELNSHPLPAARQTEPEVVENARLDNIEILLAEDCIDNQFLICTFLTKVGAKVDVVDNGQKALEMVKSKDYDLILMDIQMPVMDGYEAASQIRQLGYRTPMIALTAHALKGEREYCLKMGFDEHNTKPINRKTLISSVIRTLAKHH